MCSVRWLGSAAGVMAIRVCRCAARSGPEPSRGTGRSWNSPPANDSSTMRWSGTAVRWSSTVRGSPRCMLVHKPVMVR